MPPITVRADVGRSAETAFAYVTDSSRWTSIARLEARIEQSRSSSSP